MSGQKMALLRFLLHSGTEKALTLHLGLVRTNLRAFISLVMSTFESLAGYFRKRGSGMSSYLVGSSIHRRAICNCCLVSSLIVSFLSSANFNDPHTSPFTLSGRLLNFSRLLFKSPHEGQKCACGSKRWIDRPLFHPERESKSP